MNKILLIGGAGFIGSAIASSLANNNDYDVTVVGRSSIPKNSLPINVKYKKADLLDDDLNNLVSGYDCIVDLAYATQPSSNYHDPVLDILDNVPIHVRLFKACLKEGIGKYIYISSGGTVYGEHGLNKVSESSSESPISPYGITKLAIEKYALMFHIHSGFPVIIVRPSNPFGVNQLSNIGQGFVAAVCRSLMRGEEINIFGKRGTVRDYIYIQDLVDGIISLINFGRMGQVYNVGSSIGYDNIDIVEKISGLLGIQPPKINFFDKRNFDVSFNVLDITKIKKTTGWEPNFDLESGLCKMFEGMGK
jgi:UDP-glucose 4-epimerase